VIHASPKVPLQEFHALLHADPLRTTPTRSVELFKRDHLAHIKPKLRKETAILSRGRDNPPQSSILEFKTAGSCCVTQ